MRTITIYKNQPRANISEIRCKIKPYDFVLVNLRLYFTIKEKVDQAILSAIDQIPNLTDNDIKNFEMNVRKLIMDQYSISFNLEN